MPKPDPPLPLPSNAIYTPCYCEENIYLLAQTFVGEANANANATGRPNAWSWEIFVVFVSNGGKTVALWSQKARAGGVVVWDYHVFLVLRPLPRDRPHTSTPGDHECAHAPAPPPQSQSHSDSDSDSATRRTNAPARADPGPGPEGDHDQAIAWVYDFDTTLPVPCPWKEYVAGTFPYAFDDALAAHIDPQFLSLFRVIPASVYLDYFASDRSHMILSGPGAAETGAPGGTDTDTSSDSDSDSDSLAAPVLVPPLPAPDGTAAMGASAVGTNANGSSMCPLHLFLPAHRVSPIPIATPCHMHVHVGRVLAYAPRAPDAVVREAAAAPSYSMPPPPYPPLRGLKARELGIVHNLMDSFVAMQWHMGPVSVAGSDSDANPVAEAGEEGAVVLAAERSVAMGAPDSAADADAGKAATRTRARARTRSAAGEQYGQVMDMGGFVRWLSQ